MKNWKPIYWLYLILAIVGIIILLYLLFKKPAVAPAPGNNPLPKPATTNALGQLVNAAGSWIGNIFNGGNNSGSSDNCEPGFTGYTTAGNFNALCLQANCTPGVPSAADQCVDTCGFAITSDQNPACF